jgi:cysteine-rich repeat protein
MFGLLLGVSLSAMSCGDDPSGDGGFSACVNGQFCAGDFVCVAGLCVPAGGETNGDGDPGDGDPGDGDPGDGDGDGEPGDGEPGDGEPGDGDGDGDGDPCGNGVVDDGETCDDGNSNSLDGCDADCQPSEIQLLSAGVGFSCVSFGEGVRCWGANGDGQLGIGRGFQGVTPKPLTNVGGEVVALDCGDDHSCVITAAGELRCWGSGVDGGLGYGNTNTIGDEADEMPPPPVEVGGTPTLVSVGKNHTCVVLDDGSTRCWGANQWGQLGYEHTESIGDEPGEMPPPPVDVGGTPIQLSLGFRYTCALLDTGTVRCWGWNELGQLGLEHTNTIGDTPGEMPPPAVDVGAGGVAEIGMSGPRSCARFNNGTVRCWGWGPLGYLNNGNPIGDTPGSMPPLVLDLAGNVIDFGVGNEHTCVLLGGGAVRCWGSAINGQLGYGDWNDIGDQPGEMPPADVDVGGVVTSLEMGGTHSCALMDANEVRCWGAGYANGYPDTIGDDPGEMPPMPVPLY